MTSHEAFEATGKANAKPLRLAALLIGASLAASLASVPPATAQGRDPAYAQARAAGQVGEKMDGYLGVTAGGGSSLQKLVDDINIKRKSVYAERAATQHATVEEYAFTTGCQLIAATTPGEKYQGPDGAWHVRTAAAPLRDSRCP